MRFSAAVLSVLAITMTIPPDTTSKQDEIARHYVQLVLALGQHDPDYVDAYYGPPELRAAAEKAKSPLEEIERRTRDVRSALAAVPRPAAEMERLRHDYLDRQLAALDVRLAMLKGKRLSFDEESRGSVRRGRPGPPGIVFRRARRRSRAALSRTGPARGAVREVQGRVRHSWRQAGRRLHGGHRGVPRPHGEAHPAAAGGAVHGRIRERKNLERL